MDPVYSHALLEQEEEAEKLSERDATREGEATDSKHDRDLA